MEIVDTEDGAKVYGGDGEDLRVVSKGEAFPKPAGGLGVETVLEGDSLGGSTPVVVRYCCCCICT